MSRWGTDSRVMAPPASETQAGRLGLRRALSPVGTPIAMSAVAGAYIGSRRGTHAIDLLTSALTVTLGFAVVLIYLVLAAQFQSFRDPLIVLLGSVPLAISGALVFSFLDLTTINIYSQVGLITLVGLIAKNGILIVEFANQLQAKGFGRAIAVREAALTRLRPVLRWIVWAQRYGWRWG